MRGLLGSVAVRRSLSECRVELHSDTWLRNPLPSDRSALV